MMLVFTSVFITFVGLSANEAFAHGDNPSTCSNRYDGPITTAKIIVGNQTYYPMESSTHIELATNETYTVAFTIHTTNQNFQNNSDAGTTWYSDSVYNYYFGHCVSGAGPNQDVTISRILGHTGSYMAQGIEFYTFAQSSFSYGVTWLPAPPLSPTGLTATSISWSQIDLNWNTPPYNGAPSVTGYKIERSSDSGSSWSVLASNTGSTSTSYSDTGLSSSTIYQYRVSAINNAGTSPSSNIASTTTNAQAQNGITLNNVKSTSDSSDQITISNFNTGTGSNTLLVVGVSANNNDVASITFGGAQLIPRAYSFYNNDAEFWYLANANGTGDITVIMNGPTDVVVGAYSFSGVDPADPIPTKITRHNTTPNSPKVSIMTKYANSVILDLPSIWGGVTLGSPTCTDKWNLTIPDGITGASSSNLVSTPNTASCNWTASAADYWDDVAIELKAAG